MAPGPSYFNTDDRPLNGQALTFAEELLLLLLDKSTGGLTAVPDLTRRCAFAGAVLMDLALKLRIDTDTAHLILVDSTPTGNEILDPFLAEIDWYVGEIRQNRARCKGNKGIAG